MINMDYKKYLSKKKPCLYRAYFVLDSDQRLQLNSVSDEFAFTEEDAVRKLINDEFTSAKEWLCIINNEPSDEENKISEYLGDKIDIEMIDADHYNVLCKDLKVAIIEIQLEDGKHIVETNNLEEICKNCMILLSLDDYMNAGKKFEMNAKDGEIQSFKLIIGDTSIVADDVVLK